MSEWRSRHFRRQEFSCKCGCGFDTADHELVRTLDIIRDHFDKPVTINSACRCADHNRDVGGSDNSQHLYGRAADIVVAGIDPALVAELANQMDCGGVGEYDTFTHIDTRSHQIARW